MPDRFIFSLRFSSKVFLKLAKLSLLLLLYMSLLRLNFYFLVIFHSTSGLNVSEVLLSLLTGIRFDLMVYGFLFIPIYFLILIQTISERWPKFWFSFYKFYFAATWLLVCVLTYVDFFHFTLKQKRMRFQDYLDWNFDIFYSQWMQIPNSQVYLFSALLAALLLFGISSAVSVKFGDWKDEYSPHPAGRWEVLARLAVPILLIALAARGTVEAHHLELQHSIVSANTYINEMALNAVWCFDK